MAGIHRWARDAPEEILLALGIKAGQRTGQVRPPSLKIFRRVLKNVDGQALDAALSAWVPAQVAAGRISPAQVAIALDGKVIRGSRDGDGHAVHLFSALLHGEAVVTGQREIPDKTGETKAFGPLLDELDVAGAVITADALHTVRDHANYLRGRRAFYVFTVKQNTPVLFGQLDALPWEQVPIAQTSTERGHGRDERRTIKVMPAPAGLKFPGVAQVMLIERSAPRGAVSYPP